MFSLISRLKHLAEMSQAKLLRRLSYHQLIPQVSDPNYLTFSVEIAEKSEIELSFQSSKER